MATIEEKKTELKAEMEKVVNTYNQATQTVNESRQRIVEIQGGLAALESLTETEQENA
tara:strand:- start:553 stop:726 length:174 start_codon:yes stop_codon:yes gene_type:complete